MNMLKSLRGRFNLAFYRKIRQTRPREIFWEHCTVSPYLNITDKETDESLRHIYDMKKSILGCGRWAGLDSEKKVWADYEQLLRPGFLIFFGQEINIKFFWKYCRVCTEKLHIIRINKSQKKFGKYFYGGKIRFFLGLKIWV